MTEDSRYRWKEHGARIRQARTQAGHTQKRLAELVGVDAHTVWGWEAGRMRPNQENLAAIAYHCATTPAALEGLDARQAELTPAGIGHMDPEQLTGAAVFLASADSDSVHGADLLVDNGWAAW